VFVDGTGNIEVVGLATENASVGGPPLCCSPGGPVFAARFTPTGDPLWSVPITGPFGENGSDVDADGGLVIGGDVRGPFNFAGETFAVAGPVAGAVVRLDAQGHKRWINTYPSTGFSGVGATLDRSQNVILYGTFSGTLDLGQGHTLTASSSSHQDSVIAKLSPDGATMWADQLVGDIGFPSLVDAAVDAAGNIAFAGFVDIGVTGPSLGGTSPLPARALKRTLATSAAASVPLAPGTTTIASSRDATTTTNATPLRSFALAEGTTIFATSGSVIKTRDRPHRLWADGGGAIETTVRWRPTGPAPGHRSRRGPPS
jgi:hypothetical protein